MVMQDPLREFNPQRRSTSSVSPADIAQESRQRASQMMGGLMDELEEALNAPQPELDPYPFSNSRAPLPSRQPMQGILLLTGATGLTLLAGVAFWLSLRSHSTPAVADLPPVSQPPPFIQPPIDPALLQVRSPQTAVVDSLLSSSLAQPDPEGARTLATPIARPLVLSPSRRIVAGSPSRLNPNPISVSPPVRSVGTPPKDPVIAAQGSPPAPLAQPSLQKLSPISDPSMKLVGIVRSPGTPVALILVNSNVLRQVPVGQMVKGDWVVTSITDHGVGITNGRRSYRLQMGLGENL